MASNLDAKLTKREEFVVWFTAMLMMPNENLDNDSKERVIRCVKTAVAGGMVDEMVGSKSKELDQKLFKQMFDHLLDVQTNVFNELTRLKKFLDMCYGPSKDDREVPKFKN
jgi:hypothetical protein